MLTDTDSNRVNHTYMACFDNPHAITYDPDYLRIYMIGCGGPRNPSMLDIIDTELILLIVVLPIMNQLIIGITYDFCH
jgi:hypothetical protein